MIKKRRLLWDLFFVFFKIGPTTFGGGFAMIPVVEKEIVTKRKWLSKEDITDIFALSQTIPGAVAVNVATFVGHRIGGLPAAFAALLGISLPTFSIILLLGLAYFSFADTHLLEAAFIAIRATIVALITYAAINMIKSAIIDKTSLALMVTGILALFFIHPILVLLFGAFAGVYSTYRKQKKIKHPSNGNGVPETYGEQIKQGHEI
ncbi:chromate transporter [Bacillus sp. 1P06AnD]|uniref:chromate transporter n=1 Tax=Bacillus sp. 1P06AnD TaxID=3132208 RepID=UPI0039A3BA35